MDAKTESGRRTLLGIIREHGFRAELRGETVWGEMLWTSANGNGADWEPVGTTVQDVRDWLGY